MELPMFQIVFQWRGAIARRGSTTASSDWAPSNPARTRVAVCPPTARQRRAMRAPHGWRERLAHSIDAAWPGLLTVTRRADTSKVIAGAAPLEAVRRDFARSLRDLAAENTSTTLNGIRSARSLHELWHLRPAVFNLVARHRDQSEADRRLALLNRHFPTRAPRSGFGALASPAARQGDS